MTARLMKSSGIADTFTVERTRKPATAGWQARRREGARSRNLGASKPAAPRKRRAGREAHRLDARRP